MNAIEKTYMPVNIRMEIDMVKIIDDWRRLQPLIVSRSDAIRTLIIKGLEAQGNKPK